MSDLAYLETLSNKNLHAKCLECGLPNIPVTNTTRNVILHRLRSSLLGDLMNTKNNAILNAIETFRAEIGPTIEATPTSEMSTQRSSDLDVHGKDKRRNKSRARTTNTIAPLPREYYRDNELNRSVQSTITISDVGSQSDDDEFIRNLMRTKRIPLVKQQPRQRCSVSLTKSGLLTTSYIREIQASVVEDESRPQSFIYEQPQSTDAHLHTIHNDAKQHEPNLQSQNLCQTRLNSLSYVGESKTRPYAVRNTYIGSIEPFDVTRSGLSKNTIRQRHTIGSSCFPRARLLQPTSNVNSLYPTLNGFYDQQNHSIEPVNPSTHNDSDSSTEMSKNKSQFERHFPPFVKQHAMEQVDTDSPTYQFWALINSLNRQYHLKFYIILTAVVIAVTMIYVILTP
ncbi:LEM domain-containing protein Bocksbeutel [Drosophila busckii]|uniref:LEM domain-containing protein Bocksbeutel n=1 Tax=Drosophila busckii TaxID=30019 RepID=UPI00083F281B|nr:LEM domain-containing protein Bocksbeutel [Drosophila busckii]XP_017845298.1 LEM domain-containing protein Bocksbeutel [Drosophila busckii]